MLLLEPFNPLAVALALKAGFVARGYAGNEEHLSLLIQKGVQHKGFSLIDILQPCVSFNHVNTYQWYEERVYDLAEDGHDSSDFMAAMEKARQWGDTIPIGILYREESPSFTDRIDALKDGPLTDRTYDPVRLQKLLAEF